MRKSFKVLLDTENPRVVKTLEFFQNALIELSEKNLAKWESGEVVYDDANELEIANILDKHMLSVITET